MQSPLASVLDRAGAVLTTRGDRSVAAHYGSAAGELGVCVRAVGLADRADLATLQVAGTAAGVAEVLGRVAGLRLEPSGLATASAAWWCAASPERVLVICERSRCARLHSMLREQARRLPGVHVEDASAAWSGIALVGRHAVAVLASLGALGASGEPRDAAPFAAATIDGADVRILLQTDRRALVLAEPDAACRVWAALADAGRAYGLGYVGTEAVERFALLDRVRIPTAPVR